MDIDSRKIVDCGVPFFKCKKIAILLQFVIAFQQIIPFYCTVFRAALAFVLLQSMAWIHSAFALLLLACFSSQTQFGKFRKLHGPQ